MHNISFCAPFKAEQHISDVTKKGITIENGIANYFRKRHWFNDKKRLDLLKMKKKGKNFEEKYYTRQKIQSAPT